MSSRPGTEERKPVIVFDNFSFKYYAQSKPTIRNLNLIIYEGEKVLIVGPSGSGKSTIGNCLNGLIPFSYEGEIEGSLTVAGIVTRNSGIFELSKSIGTVMQDTDSQFVGLSVAEDIAFALENDKVPQDQMISRVDLVSGIVGIKHLLRQSPQELSGGQKQRTSIAGILVDNVDILLFDEPLANLDPETGKYAIELIDRIHREDRDVSGETGDPADIAGGAAVADTAEQKSTRPARTTVIIEHRMEDVLHREVDRIILIDEGCIVADMNAHEMISSEHLTAHGLREPLYVTALKYAGVRVTADMLPGYLSTVNFDSGKKQFLSWYGDTGTREHLETGDEVLSIRNLNFEYYRGKPVLSDISFSVRSGEMISLVGTNGAGKSTIAKLICGFEKHPGGKIFFGGRDSSSMSISDRATVVGYVMQNPNQMITQTQVYDEIASGLRYRKVSEAEIEVRIDKVLDICGLTGQKKWPISALSYGQKKRVTVAAILILNPRILILDEPTAGQDYRHYTEIMEFLTRVNRFGVTVIMITHDMHLMLEYTRRSIVLSGGRIVADTDSSEVLTNPDIISKASLKETSLFHMAGRMGIPDPKSLVDRFIDFESGVSK